VRFNRIDTSGSWSVGPNSWDALHLIPNRRVIIWGVGVFEPHPNGGDFSLSYKWEIKDENNNKLFTSEVFHEDVKYR